MTGQANEICAGCGCDPSDNWFDRSLCACGSMHQRCRNCGHADDCPYDNEPSRPEADELPTIEEVQAIFRKIPRDHPSLAARPVVSPPDSTEAEKAALYDVAAEAFSTGDFDIMEDALGRGSALDGGAAKRALLAASPPSPQLAETLRAVVDRVESELHELERWAGQQNAGNAFAEQVRWWALAHLDRRLPAARAALASVAVGQPENTPTGESSP